MPNFANMLNTTRMYHITLITLAPFCILGGEIIWLAVTAPWDKLKHSMLTTTTGAGVDDRRYPAFIALAMLIPYFVFTSGLAYEITRQDITDSVDTPYSIALSSYRLDLAGIFQKQDGIAAEWLSQNSNNSTLLYTDQQVFRFIQFHRFLGQVGGIPSDASQLSPGNYMYFTRWNMDNNELTFAGYPGKTTSTTGVRKHFHFQDIPGFIDNVNSRDIIYNNSGARILAPIYLYE
jgi:uncharacterized membrane protein